MTPAPRDPLAQAARIPTALIEAELVRNGWTLCGRAAATDELAGLCADLATYARPGSPRRETVLTDRADGASFASRDAHVARLLHVLLAEHGPAAVAHLWRAALRAGRGAPPRADGPRVQAALDEIAVAHLEFTGENRARHGLVRIAPALLDRDVDVWGVRYGSSRLHRRALPWRGANPAGALVAPLRPHGIVEAEWRDKPLFDDAPLPSGRTDRWCRAHQFTLAEALYVCGVDPRAFLRDASARVRRFLRDAIRDRISL